MTLAALLQADPSSLDAAVKALTDALADGNVALAIVAGVVIAAVAVIKFLGKKIPFVDPAVEIVLSVARKLTGKKPAEVPGAAAAVEVKADVPKDPASIDNVVQIKKDV